MGGPVIVLLHGVQSSARTWRRVGQDLGHLGSEVLALDLPGHGQRPAPAKLDLEAMADDVADRMPPEVDLVVGHSLGGLVALTLAHRYPQRVNAVLLEDPPGLGPDLDPVAVAANIEIEAARARHEPEAMIAALREANPGRRPDDAEDDVADLVALDVAAVTGFLRARGGSCPRWSPSVRFPSTCSLPAVPSRRSHNPRVSASSRCWTPAR